MALTSGTKLGPYEIQSSLGAGGMGEVYRARDTRLDRSVAIKILSAAFSADCDRLVRFEQEARSASALNHPSIVTIYELGQDGSTHYIAMELIEGKTLRELLVSGLVLYEMVTGKRAFLRSTAAETLVAILREQAEPIVAQNRDAPAPLCWAIERCLAKEPDKRYVSTRELARELAAMRDCFSEKPVKEVEPRPTNLPMPRTGFVGREKETAAAKELLLRQDVRLVTVTGPGGIGKTRLAVEVASGLTEWFPGGIYFVPLSPLNDPSLITSVIVQTLGIREAGGQSPLQKLQKNF